MDDSANILVSALAQSSPNMSLMDFPGEIRTAIYRAALAPKHIWPQAGKILGGNDKSQKEGKEEINLALLATSKAIHQEAINIYYTENTFHLPRGYLLRPKVMKPPYHGLDTNAIPIIRCQNSKKIRNAALDLDIHNLNTALLAHAGKTWSRSNSMSTFMSISAGVPAKLVCDGTAIVSLLTSMHWMWQEQLLAIVMWRNVKTLHLNMEVYAHASFAAEGKTLVFTRGSKTRPVAKCAGGCNSCAGCGIHAFTFEGLRPRVMRHLQDAGWEAIRDSLGQAIEGSR